jgi:hypothetical protein
MSRVCRACVDAVVPDLLVQHLHQRRHHPAASPLILAPVLALALALPAAAGVLLIRRRGAVAVRRRLSVATEHSLVLRAVVFRHHLRRLRRLRRRRFAWGLDTVVRLPRAAGARVCRTEACPGPAPHRPVIAADPRGGGGVAGNGEELRREPGTQEPQPALRRQLLVLYAGIGPGGEVDVSPAPGKVIHAAYFPLLHSTPTHPVTPALRRPPKVNRSRRELTHGADVRSLIASSVTEPT